MRDSARIAQCDSSPPPRDEYAEPIEGVERTVRQRDVREVNLAECDADSGECVGRVLRIHDIKRAYQYRFDAFLLLRGQKTAKTCSSAGA